ncbi:MAG: isoprenylcysteine carboxylmethyltransferase family protein [Terracidiphilus sp.]|jgi:protein-S-isoprenylcysteine O-methyltransferase Ste14
MSLGWRVVLRFALMFPVAAGIVFLPAGTWNFWQGWVFLAAVFIPSLVGFAYLFFHDKAVLERRMGGREPLKEQRLLIRVFFLLFFVSFLIPGFDRRLGWSRSLLGVVPVWLTVVSLGMVAGGLVFAFWVTAVNSYAGRTIQVDEGQKVISTGPYAWVRHPMYLGSVVLWMFTPLALGSWLALPVFALMIPFYVLRLLNEEKVLMVELPGYPEYCIKTRRHLIPFVW